MNGTNYRFELIQIFKNNLKNFLEIKKIEQKDLAAVLGVSPGTVCDWIHGRAYPRPERIRAMAMFFGVNPYDLTDGKYISKEISKNEQEILDLFSDIPETEKESAINLLNNLRNSNK